MDQEIWQQLLSLESSDLTRQWYSKIHGREISTRRVKEINAAAKQAREYFRNFKAIYQNMGYKIETQEKWSSLTCDTEIFETNTPLFIHSYVHKLFGTIPELYIAEPFPDNFALSQLCITYIVAYYLGMLVRYYPTHWISLSQGDKGDGLWPT